MAKDLRKVLVESSQEVPEWLQKESEKQILAGNIYGGFGGYSGRDIRQKYKNGSSLNPFAVKPSEPLEQDVPWE